MDEKEICLQNEAPKFDESNQYPWRTTIKAHLKILEAWDIVQNGFTPPKGKPKNNITKELLRCHEIAKKAILDTLLDKKGQGWVSIIFS